MDSRQALGQTPPPTCAKGFEVLFAMNVLHPFRGVLWIKFYRGLSFEVFQHGASLRKRYILACIIPVRQPRPFIWRQWVDMHRGCFTFEPGASPSALD